jgi:hypothetical protein
VESQDRDAPGSGRNSQSFNEGGWSSVSKREMENNSFWLLHLYKNVTCFMLCSWTLSSAGVQLTEDDMSIKPFYENFAICHVNISEMIVIPVFKC